jgi:hypothetical protein
MKYKFPLVAIFFILLNFDCFSQITLPKGFHCVLGINHANESYFTNGVFTFKTYPWGHEGIAGKEVANLLEDNYSHKIKFQKTKDNLYWATGKVDDAYLYIVIASENLQYTLSSKMNSSEFSDYSAWLLKQIRTNIAAGSELYFTDYNGKSCFGMK